ncbi:hypothetical protein FBUS_04843 [Fasciolopsis buskii]|uniref:Uncharacterized protein n=1 Tax=Fasciolopsis buskii TaxID=27845 RepID=A0A8E0S581_9TREM|nr:hypothetical protein FBUS_04843 [Fasciolopsis buski]
MPGRTEKPKRKTQNKPSFDYQLEEEDEDLGRMQPASNSNRSCSENPVSLDLSDPAWRQKTESDPLYQVYHKPNVAHPLVLLILCIASLLISITLIVLDALVLSEAHQPWYIGSGVWPGVLGLAATVTSMTFLHFQNNCLAIVVLNLDVVGMCVNLFCFFHAIIFVNFVTNVLPQTRAKHIGICSLCFVFLCIIVAHFVLMCMATCTRFKRKSCESSS